MFTKTKKAKAAKAKKTQAKDTQSTKHPSSQDNFLQFVLENRQVALDFFQAHILPEISQKIDWSTFRIADAARRAEREPVSHTDITYHAKVKGTKGNMVAIYLQVEHQRNIDSKIVERIGQYNIRLFLKHSKQSNRKWPIIVSMVRYNGTKKNHPYHEDPYEYFEDAELVRFLMDQPYTLVNLNQIPDQALPSHPACGLMEILLKRTSSANFISWFETNRSVLRRYASVNYLGASLKYAPEVVDANANSIIGVV